MAGYEGLTVWEDPFDLMCGDCKVHTYETWNPVTEDELRKDWEMEKLASEIDPMFPTPAATFEGWLAENLASGWIRETK